MNTSLRKLTRTIRHAFFSLPLCEHIRTVTNQIYVSFNEPNFVSQYLFGHVRLANNVTEYLSSGVFYQDSFQLAIFCTEFFLPSERFWCPWLKIKNSFFTYNHFPLIWGLKIAKLRCPDSSRFFFGLLPWQLQPWH